MAAAVVPTQVLPLYGWLLTYEWALFTFAVAFGTYLHLCFKAGAGTLCFARRGLPPPAAPRGKGAAALKPWRPTLAYAAAAVVLLCLFPWVSAAIGQRGLAAKVSSDVGTSFVSHVIAGDSSLGCGSFVAVGNLGAGAQHNKGTTVCNTGALMLGSH